MSAPITVYVNGKQFDTLDPWMPYYRVLQLAGLALDSGAVVTYKKASGGGGGSLAAGQQVKKTEGMQFTAVKPKAKK